MYSRYDFIAEPVSNGLALIGSWSGSICNWQADFAVSTALFSTDSNDSSLSVYEKGLRYTYNYISLYGKGARASATVRFRLSNDIQLYFKAGSTLYTDRNEIGQAQQRIPSGHKEDVSLQLIAKFWFGKQPSNEYFCSTNTNVTDYVNSALWFTDIRTGSQPPSGSVTGY